LKKQPVTLAVDVGGSHVKASLLDPEGRVLNGPLRADTPAACRPPQLLSVVSRLARALGRFDRISLGLPGLVREGCVVDAPNLSKSGWPGFRLDAALKKRLGRPARIVNDADMQGCGAARGVGIELVVTLGTGIGTALFDNGRLLPHLELGLAYHPAPKGVSYNEYIGDRARRRVGDARWGRRVRRFLDVMRDVTHFDAVYIGGGNARRLRFALDDDVHLVSNRAGLLGGIVLWGGAREDP
jgi:polyphosphate glucokinase